MKIDEHTGMNLPRTAVHGPAENQDKRWLGDLERSWMTQWASSRSAEHDARPRVASASLRAASEAELKSEALLGREYPLRGVESQSVESASSFRSEVEFRLSEWAIGLNSYAGRTDALAMGASVERGDSGPGGSTNEMGGTARQTADGQGNAGLHDLHAGAVIDQAQSRHVGQSVLRTGHDAAFAPAGEANVTADRERADSTDTDALASGGAFTRGNGVAERDPFAPQPAARRLSPPVLSAGQVSALVEGPARSILPRAADAVSTVASGRHSAGSAVALAQAVSESAVPVRNAVVVGQSPAGALRRQGADSDLSSLSDGEMAPSDGRALASAKEPPPGGRLMVVAGTGADARVTVRDATLSTADSVRVGAVLIGQLQQMGFQAIKAYVNGHSQHAASGDGLARLPAGEPTLSSSVDVATSALPSPTTLKPA